MARTDPDDKGAGGISAFIVEPRTPGHHASARPTARWASGRAHLRRDLRGLPRAGGEPDRRRRGPRLQDRDEGARQGPHPHRRGLRRRGRAHAATTRCATRSSASSSASRSPSSSWSRRCWPTASAEIYAARSMVLDAARRRDDGVDVATEASCCKLFASEMCGRVADRAVQILGGAGYMRGLRRSSASTATCACSASTKARARSSSSSSRAT